MLGQSLWNLGKYNEAIASHTQAIQYGKLANNNSRIAFSWEKLGDLFKLTGEKTKALTAYDSSANYYAVIKDSSAIINNFNNVGDVYKNDKNYTKAIEYYNKAYQYAKVLSSKNRPSIHYQILQGLIFHTTVLQRSIIINNVWI